MAAVTALTDVEERVVGHLRRLTRDDKDFELVVRGMFRSGQRVLDVKYTRSQRFELAQRETECEAYD